MDILVDLEKSINDNKSLLSGTKDEYLSHIYLRQLIMRKSLNDNILDKYPKIFNTLANMRESICNKLDLQSQNLLKDFNGDEFLVIPGKEGGNWYSIKGSLEANFTYDSLITGIDLSGIAVLDRYCLENSSFDSINDLEVVFK